MTIDKETEKIIVPTSGGDMGIAKAIILVFCLFLMSVVAFYNKGVSAGPVILLLLATGGLFSVIFFQDQGTQMEINHDHIAVYKLYRHKKPKLLWMEKFSDNRQLILQEARIQVGKNEYRDGIKLLVYGKGYQTHTKIAFVKYTPGLRDQVLNMIDMHKLPVRLTKE